MDEAFFDRKGRKKFDEEVVPIEKTGYFAILIKKNKVLVSYPPQVDVPEFPGGSMKRWEDFRECLFRKLYEETGVEFMLDKGMKTFEHVINYFADDERPYGVYYIYKQIFIVYDASSYGFEINLPRWKTPENGWAEWVSLDDIFKAKTKINYTHWLAVQELFADFKA